MSETVQNYIKTSVTEISGLVLFLLVFFAILKVLGLV